MTIDRPNDLESPASEWLRLNDPATCATESACSEAGSLGRTEPFEHGGARRDPRDLLRLSDRDIAALRFIALWICAQYQLAIALFPGKSETAVSRCVQRLLRLGLIRVTRWNRIGLNMLQLRTAGARLLVERGVLTEHDLFIPRAPIATKDLAHSLWIVDTGLAFGTLPVSFDVLPCWALRRRYAGQKIPVPDLLAVNHDGTRVIVVEIDLATERTKVLVAKLRELAGSLRRMAPEATVAIIVLTVGARRIDTLSQQCTDLGVPTVIDALPPVVGRPAVPALATLLRG